MPREYGPFSAEITGTPVAAPSREYGPFSAEISLTPVAAPFDERIIRNRLMALERVAQPFYPGFFSCFTVALAFGGKWLGLGAGVAGGLLTAAWKRFVHGT